MPSPKPGKNENQDLIKNQKILAERMDYIEGALIEQNDSLKKELWRVGMVIDVYESKSD